MPNDNKKNMAGLKVRKEYLVCVMLSNTDSRQYTPLKNKLVNGILLVSSNYHKTHKTRTRALSMINHYMSKTFTQQLR